MMNSWAVWIVDTAVYWLILVTVSSVAAVFKVIDTVLNVKRKMLGPPVSLQEKVVLVTGASSGLGEALARRFYEEGCRVIIASRRLGELERVRQDLSGEGTPPVVLPLDLEDCDKLPATIKAALEIYGHIDILVNNGGISYRGEIENTTAKVHEKIMKVNYFGTVTTTRAVLPSMVSRGNGHIVMIGSLQSKLAIPFRSAYAASKHALQAFSDCLRAEVAKDGIQVTVVNPSYIRSNLSMNSITNDGQFYGKSDSNQQLGLSCDQVATRIISGIKDGEHEIIIGSPLHRLTAVLRNVLPSLYFRAMIRRANVAENTSGH